MDEIKATVAADPCADIRAQLEMERAKGDVLRAALEYRRCFARYRELCKAADAILGRKLKELESHATYVAEAAEHRWLAGQQREVAVAAAMRAGGPAVWGHTANCIWASQSGEGADIHFPRSLVAVP